MSRTVKVAPIDPPKLYPDNPRVILRQAYEEIYSASGGSLNDFSSHSPIVALCEGMLVPVLEELFYANQLPDAIGLSFLKRSGVVRILGSSAVVTLTFTLTTPLATPFTLSAGYIVKNSAGREYTTDSVLVIPAGQGSGTVTATATAIIDGVRQSAIGSAYNSPAFTIRTLTETRAYLQGVVNTEPATGGTDGETLEQMRSRAFVLLRSRNTLISADDYEQAAIAYLGAGATAIAIGALSSDKQTRRDGAIAVFVLNGDRTVPNFAQLTGLRAHLADRSCAGLGNLVSTHGIELFTLEVRIVAELQPGSDPEAIAQLVNAQVDVYLSPGRLAIGESLRLKKLEVLIDDCGVAGVQSVSLIHPSDDGLTYETYYGDVQMPNRWSTPVLVGLDIALLDLTSDQRFEYSFGESGDKD